MAKRRLTKHRRSGTSRRFRLGGMCEAADCPFEAYAEVFIPDSGRKHKLCGPHATAVERQIRRNEEHARGKGRKATEERLGLR